MEVRRSDLMSSRSRSFEVYPVSTAEYDLQNWSSRRWNSDAWSVDYSHSCGFEIGKEENIFPVLLQMKFAEKRDKTLATLRRRSFNWIRVFYKT